MFNRRDGRFRAGVWRLGCRGGLFAVGTALDDDVAEEVGLLGAELALAAELEDGQERDDDVGAAALAAGHGAEEERPGVAQQREDLGHPLQDGRWVGLDLARARTLLLLDQPLHR